MPHAKKTKYEQMIKDSTLQEIDKALAKAVDAFHEYKKYSLKQRADFMRAIAIEIEALGDELIHTAANESNLPVARLNGERARTIFQLNSYADATEAGNWLNVSIDTVNVERTPPKPDIRKTCVPLGPVVIFGASNFPFAFSTAGGDTASAFGAGCPVIVKAHPGHLKTSTLMASAISAAAKKCNMPEGIFSHIHGSSFETGTYLAKHPKVKAIGFTGSFNGGKALFDLANQREVPIPVFAEMGSVNPVFLLAEKLANENEMLATQLANSVTLGMGQFCTNPGLIIAIDNEHLNKFIDQLRKEIEILVPSPMLHQGIANNYQQKLDLALSQKGVQLIGESTAKATTDQGQITVATATADSFLRNPILHQEVFGPYSLIIKCVNESELLAVAKAIEGQLTTTLMATVNDVKAHEELLNTLQETCGRLIFNNLPTGVEVCLSMHHGGPFPASSNSSFTSVGADGIKRFARPLCYQNCDDEFLPDELKNANPLQLFRTVNNELTKNKIV